MACRMFGATKFYEKVMWYYYLDLDHTFKWNSNKNTKYDILENSFQNVLG